MRVMCLSVNVRKPRHILELPPCFGVPAEFPKEETETRASTYNLNTIIRHKTTSKLYNVME